jgi:hypothetical protein
MQVLFDQGTPVPLHRYLISHTVVTVFEKGWSSMQNGALLDIAEAEGFDGLVTTDQSLKYQQNLSNRRIAIVVLTTTSWAIIERGVKQITEAIDAMKPGAYVEIAF